MDVMKSGPLRKMEEFGPQARRQRDDVDEAIACAVRRSRSLLGMSQESLGEKIGVTFQQVQKYERSRNRIAASTLYRIARALDVPVASFFSGLEGAGAGDAAEQVRLTQDEFRLVRAHRKIRSEVGRRQALELVRGASRLWDSIGN